MERGKPGEGSSALLVVLGEEPDELTGLSHHHAHHMDEVVSLEDVQLQHHQLQHLHEHHHHHHHHSHHHAANETGQEADDMVGGVDVGQQHPQQHHLHPSHHHHHNPLHDPLAELAEGGDNAGTEPILEEEEMEEEDVQLDADEDADADSDAAEMMDLSEASGHMDDEGVLGVSSQQQLTLHRLLGEAMPAPAGASANVSVPLHGSHLEVVYDDVYRVAEELRARPEMSWLRPDHRTLRFLRDVRTMTKRDRELYILVLLKQARCSDAGHTAHGRKRKRIHYAYEVPPFGKVSRAAFCHLFSVTPKYLKNLQAYYGQTDSVLPRVHGNSGRPTPSKKISKEHLDFADEWIRHIMRLHGSYEVVRLKRRPKKPRQEELDGHAAAQSSASQQDPQNHRQQQPAGAAAADPSSAPPGASGQQGPFERVQICFLAHVGSINELFRHFRAAFAERFPEAKCFGAETFRRILHRNFPEIRFRAEAVLHQVGQRSQAASHAPTQQQPSQPMQRLAPPPRLL